MRGASIQQRFCQGFARLHVRRFAGDDKTCRGIEHGDVAFCAFDRAAEDAFDDGGVLHRISADEFLKLRGSKTEGGGIQRVFGKRTASYFAYLVRPERGQLVHAAKIFHRTVNDPRALTSECQQDLAKSTGQRRIKNTDKLVIRARWIQQRAEQIEDGALTFRAENLAGFRHGFEGGMIQRGKKEPEADGFDPACHAIDRQINADTQSLQHIGTAGLAGHTTIAVLGHTDSAGSENEHRGRGDIEEMQFVTTRAHHIQHRSGQLCAVETRIDGQLQKLLHKRGDLCWRLAFLRQGAQESSLCGSGFIPGYQKGSRFPHLGGSQAVSGFERLENVVHRADCGRGVAIWQTFSIKLPDPCIFPLHPFTMSPILGIDLGTTNSLVGVVDSGFPILLADEHGQRLTPSAVNYAADGGIIVGAAALRKRALEPKRTVTSVKRLIGRRGGEGDWQPPYNLRELGLSPIQVSAEILKRLKAIAERALEQPVNRAVITVPAYFNDAQRNATKQAGELAGLTVERIVSEPTAAALAYGLDKLGERQKIAVYDLGGGTFDISVLEMRDGVFQVLSTAGDTQLGGDDIDRALAESICPDGVNPARLVEAAEAAKKRLSMEESTRIELPFYDGTNSLSVELTRTDFEKLIRPLVERTRSHCLRALSDAGVKPDELDAVILVGGSTRIPLVRRYVAEIFGREPDISQNPDEAVALGAVIQAGILSGSLKNVLLLDVTPLSLGIETFGGLMNIIIPRNTTIPCKAGEMFTNAVANQQDMLIRVLQGERELANDNWELGRVIVPFPAGPKGSARVGVQFAIDANGILQVLARDTATNTDTVLEIQNTAVDVDDERVEQMISESVEHAFEDMNERVWTEAKLKAEELLPAVDAALAQFGDAVSDDERAIIESAAATVRALLHAADRDAKALKAANQAIDDATQELAVRLVERAMEESLVRRGLV